MQRNVISASWDTVAVRALPSDTFLMLPIRMDAGLDGAVVFDAGPSRLVSFDTHTDVRWVLGKKGSGPGEFARVRDLDLRDDGTVVVLDAGAARLTIVEADGSSWKHVRLDLPGSPERVVGLDDGSFVILTFGRTLTLLHVDSLGQSVGVVDVGWDGWNRIAPLAGQSIARASPDGRRWVLGFVFGNGWFAYEGLEASSFVGRYVEHTAFPAVIEERGTQSRKLGRVTVSAADISVTKNRLYVLFGGNTRIRGRVIDEFEVASGTYVGSVLLPSKPTLMAAATNGLFYIVEDDPFPRLWVGRPRQRQ